MNKVKILISIVSMGMMVGCAGSTGVVKLEKDRYMVSDKNPKVGFVSAAEEKASVYKQANEFCAEQKKEVKTLNLEMVGSGAWRQASATLEFTCVK